MRHPPVAAGGILVAVAALLALAPAVSYSSPADPNVVKRVEQPDGAVLSLRLWGDEYAHGYETLNGFTTAYDRADKIWKYAKRDGQGRLTPSGVVVGRGASPVAKHLRPAPAVIDEARGRNAPPAGQPALPTPPPWAGADTDTLFIFLEFSDAGCSFTPAQMRSNLFGGGASGPGDLDDYFRELSRGKLELVGSVVGNSAGSDCVRASRTKASYNDQGFAAGAEALVEEVIGLVNPHVNFSQYDNDNNGVIDALGIIYAGGSPHEGCYPENPPTGTATGDGLWPHSGFVSGVSADGKSFGNYIINSEVTYPIAPPQSCNVRQSIGLFAHEFGHSLGLPDLYDYDGSSAGVGAWSTMGSYFLATTNNGDTPPHYDPWSKSFLGWVTPVGHAAGDRFVEPLARVEDSGEVHRFLSNPGGVQVGSGSGEYFLAENRQRVLFDSKLPGCGVLVWHIDEAVTPGPFGGVNEREGHSAGSHYLVDVEEADGLAELDDQFGIADDGDPFPGSSSKTLFADSTNPTAKLYSGANSGVRAQLQTTSCASSMTVAFGPPGQPAALPPDFNRDGFADLAIGVPGEDIGGAGDAGAVHVLYGSAFGLRATGGGFFTQASSGTGSNEAGDRFGEAVSTGDFNRDGFTDLAVGAPAENVGSLADAGAVSVLYGGSAGIDGTGNFQVLQANAAGANEAGDRFGAAVAAGDVTNDQFADLSVGAPDENAGSTSNVGVVNVLYGGSAGIDASGNSQLTQAQAAGATEAGDRFGAALAIGDFNSSGAADLAVGAPDESVGSAAGAGAISLLNGGGFGIGAHGAALFVQGEAGGTTEQGDRFGAALAAGDLDGRGAADLAVGAPTEDFAPAPADAGAVNILYGGSSGIDASGNTLIVQDDAAGTTEAGDRFGAALATGNFNNAGAVDLSVGAPDEDAGSLANAGVVNLLYGGGFGVGAHGVAQFVQANAAGTTEAGDRFGAALVAGDFNAAGGADLAAGAPDEAVGSTSFAGALNILYGASSGVGGGGKAQLTQGSTGTDPVEASDRFGSALR